MTNSNWQGILFDLDGTLLDTLEDIGNATNAVLLRHGFPPHPLEAYRYFIGEGVRVLMQRALPASSRDEPTLEACLQTMRQEYARHLNRTARVYPGVPELLLELKERRLKLAVLSNKADRFTRQCVAQYFDRLFEAVVGLRDGFARKPDPATALDIARQLELEPSDMLYLGDTGTDMETARRAGMFPVGALWGYRCRQELLAAGAKALIETPGQLLDMAGKPR